MKKQYRVRVTTHYPSFVVQAENEEQAKELVIKDHLETMTDHPDACSFIDLISDFEVEEEDVEDDDAKAKN